MRAYALGQHREPEPNRVYRSAYLEGRVVRECGVEEVPDGEVDLGLKQVVLKDDEAGVRWS